MAIFEVGMNTMQDEVLILFRVSFLDIIDASDKLSVDENFEESLKELIQNIQCLKLPDVVLNRMSYTMIRPRIRLLVSPRCCTKVINDNPPPDGLTMMSISDMVDCVTLSSDSEEERITTEEEAPATPDGPHGIPKTFKDDENKSFNFGSTFSETPKQAKKRTSEVMNESKRSRITDSPFNVDLNELAEPERWTPIVRRRSISVCPGTPTTSQTEPVVEPKENLRVRALVSPVKKQKKNKTTEVANEFYGVYCLISRSDRACYKNRCYIGYTVDPNRRIAQHNGGREKGGAKKTDSRGPWDMVCVVHGFPNHVAALRFEWAWQNPSVSKVLKEEKLKKERKETPFQYQLRIACHLMNSKPFCRFALTFRWLIASEEKPFPPSVPPPAHVKKRFGKVVKEKSVVPVEDAGWDSMGTCSICEKNIEKMWHLMRCTSPGELCSAHFHAKCLAEKGLEKTSEVKNQLFPLKANCPRCGHSFVWGDAVREQRRIIKVAQAAVDEQHKTMVVRKGL